MTTVVNTGIEKLEDDLQSNAENSSNNVFGNNPSGAIKPQDLSHIQEEDYNISRKGSYYPE